MNKKQLYNKAFGEKTKLNDKSSRTLEGVNQSPMSNEKMQNFQIAVGTVIGGNQLAKRNSAEIVQGSTSERGTFSGKKLKLNPSSKIDHDSIDTGNMKLHMQKLSKDMLSIGMQQSMIIEDQDLNHDND